VLCCPQRNSSGNKRRGGTAHCLFAWATRRGIDPFTQRTRALYLHTLGPITPAPSKKEEGEEAALYPPAPCAMAVHLKRLSNFKRPRSYVFFSPPLPAYLPREPCLSCLSVCSSQTHPRKAAVNPSQREPYPETDRDVQSPTTHAGTLRDPFRSATPQPPRPCNRRTQSAP
jgi:hypothetical protein